MGEIKLPPIKTNGIEVGSTKNKLVVGADGILRLTKITIGTSSVPLTSATADNKFMELRCKTTATSGDNRLAYLRFEQNGAGGGGECIRAFTKATAALGTARGAHISLDLSTAGTCSGFGAGVDAQVLIGDAAQASLLTALNAEIYAGGASTAITAGKTSFLRCVIGGNATGIADIESNASFLSFANAAASGNMVDSDITVLTGKAGLRVYVNNALYGYIPIVTGT